MWSRPTPTPKGFGNMQSRPSESAKATSSCCATRRAPSSHGSSEPPEITRVSSSTGSSRADRVSTSYYSGHGAPTTDGGAYLVPVDADARRIQLNGYPLELLYRNLGKLPAVSV